MTDRELMQQALEALELLARCEHPLTKIQVRKPRDGGSIVTVYPHQVATDAAEPLRERLAQPEQEPVAWVKQSGELVVRTDYGGRLYYSDQSVYTTPPQRKPLTDELKDAFFDGFTSVVTYNDTWQNSPEEAWDEYKAAHGIKGEA